MNYKMHNVIQGFFSEEKKFFHKFNFEGKDHILTPFDIEENDPRLLQSFANYCKKNSKNQDGGSGSGSGQDGQGMKGEQNEGNSTGRGDGMSGGVSQEEAKEVVESDTYNKLFNEARKEKASKGLQDKDAGMRGEVELPANITSSQLDDIKLIKRELTRLSEIRTKKKDKLNLPKVFEALLSQPHTALEKKKDKELITRNLVIFVDVSVGYHQQIPGCKVSLHNSIIYACKDLPFVDLFYSQGMHNFDWKNNYYAGIGEALKSLDEIYKKKKKKMHKILVFTQGCGNLNHDQYQGYEHLVEFLTPFAQGCNCGCHRIAHARDQGCNMHYSVHDATYLKTLEV